MEENAPNTIDSGLYEINALFGGGLPCGNLVRVRGNSFSDLSTFAFSWASLLSKHARVAVVSDPYSASEANRIIELNRETFERTSMPRVVSPELLITKEGVASASKAITQVKECAHEVDIVVVAHLELLDNWDPEQATKQFRRLHSIAQDSGCVVIATQYNSPLRGYAKCEFGIEIAFDKANTDAEEMAPTRPLEKCCPNYLITDYEQKRISEDALVVLMDDFILSHIDERPPTWKALP